MEKKQEMQRAENIVLLLHTCHVKVSYNIMTIDIALTPQLVKCMV